MWVNDEDCKRVIVEGWDGMGTNNISDLAIEMDRCGERLKRWNKQAYRSLQYKIANQQKELEKLLHEVQCVEDTVMVEKCKQKLLELERKKEVY